MYGWKMEVIAEERRRRARTHGEWYHLNIVFFCTRSVRLLKCTCSDVNRKMFRHGPYPLAGSTMKHSTGM